MEPTNFRAPERWNTIPVPDQVAERAATNYTADENGCWISNYSSASHGYAQVGWSIRAEEKTGRSRHRMVLAHRAAWAYHHGQVPVGMTIDHTCKVRKCVNPAHLRLLSNLENSRRNQGDDFPKGYCRHGHPDSALVRVKRKTKSGEPRYGITCGMCQAAARVRWRENNPEKYRAQYERSNARRKAA